MSKLTILPVALALLVLALGSVTALDAEPSGSPGIIIAAEAPLFSSPEVGASVTATLPRGTEIEIKSSTGDLLEVSLSTGQHGWTPAGKVGLKVDRDGRVCVQVGFEQALDEGLITAEFSGAGGYRGESVAATFTTSAEVGIDICPSIRPGLALIPSNGSGAGDSQYQRMALRSVRRQWKGTFEAFQDWLSGYDFEGAFEATSAVVLDGSKGQESTYLFEAYCLDADKIPPREGLSFHPSFDWRSRSVDRVLEGSDLPSHLLGLAVWAAVHAEDGGSLPGDLCNELDWLEEADPAGIDQLKAVLETIDVDLNALVSECHRA